MATIRQLPPGVVNKIAAGEVIERPASIVKELVENSLDAGATRIEVSLEQGGMELVRVVDDGGGISPEQLPLAVASHATSKLETADDLFRVRTLGFRGEALASIAEVSRFLMRSRTAADTAGAELSVVTGTPSDVAPCGCPVGTIVEVRNLFVNTPVRRKFLRSTQTEMGHISEAFTRLALAHPHVHFSLRHNERAIYDLPPCGEWVERIASFFGSELADALIWIESDDSAVRLAGYVAHPSQNRAHPRMQYLFLNGRHIRDRALQHALAEAYRGLLLGGRYPISFLCFDMPPEMVDVNVHPTKLEVRFQDGGRLYSQLLGTIRTKFLATDLTHVLDAYRALPADAASTPAAPRIDAQELVGWAKGELAARLGQPTSAGMEVGSGAAATASFAHASDPFSRGNGSHGGAAGTWLPPGGAMDSPGLAMHSLERRWQALATDEPEPNGFDPSAPSGGEHDRFDTRALDTPSAALQSGRDGASWEGGLPLAVGDRTPAAVQIHNRYLVTESAEGVLVIDQHALHERILYEQMRTKALAGALETQNLLVPEPVDLTPAEAAAVLGQQELLAQLGLRVEAFGGGTVLVGSYPAMLAGANVGQLLRDLVEPLLSESASPERRDLLDELLHMMSCKAAIKAGDRLTSEEITSLLEQRHLARDTHHCPHGRPTALVFTREELDRQFKRT